MMIEFSSLIEFHRKQAGLSQIELADIAGVSRKVVQNIEGGKTSFEWRNLDALLHVLNIRLEPTGPLVAAWRESLPQAESDE